MKTFLKTALEALPLVALAYFAGIVVIAMLSLSSSDTRMAFGAWSLICLAGWAVLIDDLTDRGNK